MSVWFCMQDPLQFRMGDVTYLRLRIHLPGGFWGKEWKPVLSLPVIKR